MSATRDPLAARAGERFEAYAERIGKRGPSRAPRVKQYEDPLTMAVAAYLVVALPDGSEWTHIPHGGARNKIVAKKLKAMGVRRGAPDFVIAPPPVPALPIVWLELKTEDGTLSAEQKRWRDALRLLPPTMSQWFLCRSVDQVGAALREAGYPLRVRFP